MLNYLDGLIIVIYQFIFVDIATGAAKVMNEGIGKLGQTTCLKCLVLNLLKDCSAKKPACFIKPTV